MCFNTLVYEGLRILFLLNKYFNFPKFFKKESLILVLKFYHYGNLHWVSIMHISYDNCSRNNCVKHNKKTMKSTLIKIRFLIDYLSLWIK